MSVKTPPAPKQAPREAFAWHAQPIAFRDSAGDEREKPNEHRVDVQARSPGVVHHWYWGRIVHDMAGCQHKDKVPFDWRHDPDQVVGFADQITADDDGLRLSGPIQSTKEGDRASEIINRGTIGQPYEASFYWDGWNNSLEYLDEGFTAEVNGQTIDGPCVIARQWILRGCAITPYGVDQTTHTKFSADGSAEIPVTFRPAEGATMTKDATKPTDTKPAEQTEPTKDSATATKPATVESTKPAGEVSNPEATKDAARGELGRYMERFGTERGAEYFRDSVPYQSALEKEVDHLRKEAATKDEAAKAAEAKLAAVNVGETDPVDTGHTKDEAKPSWEGLFRKQGSK